MNTSKFGGPGKGRAHSGTLATLLGITLAIALGACTTEAIQGAVDKARAGSPSPTPTGAKGAGDNSKVPGSVGTDASVSPSSSPTSNNVAATALPSGTTVSNVSISPETFDLNVPAADGDTTSLLPTSQKFTATVKLSPAGQNGQVTWTASSDKVTLTPSGTAIIVSVNPDTPAGTVTLTATSKQDSARSTTASVNITRSSQLSLDIK